MTKNLFFDTDCLSAFLWIGDTNVLQKLYAGRIIFPEPVYLELSNPCISHIKKRADDLIASNLAAVQEIQADTEEYKIYQSLVNGEKGCKNIGHGEAGGIALAKTYQGTLASNNYRDIAPYIQKYKLKHIDTGHILLEALKKNIITEKDGNHLWKQMLSKRRRLPAGSFSEYLHSQLSFSS